MVTTLCKLAFKYGSDKCPRIKHSYTPLYYRLLKDKRRKIKKVLEMGIGYAASLHMWHDFFPNAQIFGADNNPEALLESDRIKTFFCDERKKEDIVELIKNTGSDIDLFIDDGNHNSRRQAFLAKILMSQFQKDVVYIIEDVYYPNSIINALSEYDCQVFQFSPKFRDDRLIIVKHKGKN